MKQYTSEEIKQLFEKLELPTNNQTQFPLKQIDMYKQPTPKFTLSVGTSSKFVYSD
jgi:hypothetical protein